MGDEDRLGDFEARLAALKHKMERGLVDRARLLRELADRVEAGEQSARKQLKTESHKLRGVAGSYGHQALTDLAGQLEQRASVSPPAAVSGMARELADLAEARGRASEPPSASSSQPAPSSGAASARPSRAPRASGIKSPLPETGPALRVLAMDDDPVTQRLLLLTLKQVGHFDAVIVSSAAAALELLRSEPFDIVVSDAMMPDMNGREFRRAARAAGVGTPIVILSAASPQELGWAGEGEEVDSWLRKPFKPSELVRDIRRIVARHAR